MHEVAAMQAAVATMLETARQVGALRVTSANLVLGASGHFSEEAARQHFHILTKNTVAEEASLTISWLPTTFRCFSCLHNFESCDQADMATCPMCGESALSIAHQDVCAIDSIDVVFADELARQEEEYAIKGSLHE